METSCAIVKLNESGLYWESSIRSSGTLGCVGAALFKWYQDPDKIDRLLMRGWVPRLEPEPEDHRGLTFNGDVPILHSARETAIRSGLWQGDVYLWENNAWYLIAVREDDEKSDTVMSLTEPLCITRELLLTVEPSIDVFLDDTTKPLTSRAQLEMLMLTDGTSLQPVPASD